MRSPIGRENAMKKKSLTLIAALGAIAGIVVTSPAEAQERAVKIAGFGAKSGVVRVFGINSEAALKAALEQINNAGGVTLGDGTKGKIALEYYDDRCNAEEGISVVRRIASTGALMAVGPTCSNVAESLFGILQKKVGDSSDSGLQFPIIADRKSTRLNSSHTVISYAGFCLDKKYIVSNMRLTSGC